MEVYTSECGNTKGINYKMEKGEKRPTIYYNGEEYLITVGFTSFYDNDKKEFLENYDHFRRVYGELSEVYERKDYNALSNFVALVLNNRNFIISVCSKPFMLAKITYVTLHGRNNYASRGYATLLISDLTRLNDDFIYYLLTASKNRTYNSFKKLLECLRDCSYYISDFRNKFKQDITKLLWRKSETTYERDIYDLNLDSVTASNQLFSLISLASLTARWNTGGTNEDFMINKVYMYHNDKYKYDQDKLIDIGVPYFNIEYIRREKEQIIQIIDDFTKILYAEFNRLIDVFRNNGNYENSHFKFISLIFNRVTQLNCEFQLPVNEVALIMSVMDLIKEKIGTYYHQRHVVDYLVISHYTRLSEYLKNHGDEISATKVLRTRV